MVLQPLAGKVRRTDNRDGHIDWGHDPAVVIAVVVADRTVDSGFPIEGKEHERPVVVMDGNVHRDMEQTPERKGGELRRIGLTPSEREGPCDDWTVERILHRNPTRIFEEQRPKGMLHRLLDCHVSKPWKVDGGTSGEQRQTNVRCETANSEPQRFVGKLREPSAWVR